MDPREWMQRAARDLGEEWPPDGGEDASLAFVDRLFANEEASGRLERIYGVEPAWVPVDAEDQIVQDTPDTRWIYHPDGRLTIISRGPKPSLPELDEQ
jgi:hypothetical protein